MSRFLSPHTRISSIARISHISLAKTQLFNVKNVGNVARLHKSAARLQKMIRPPPTSSHEAKLTQVLDTIKTLELQIAKENGLEQSRLATKLNPVRRSRILVLGEPHSGKSTLINALIDDDSIRDDVSAKIHARNQRLETFDKPTLIEFGLEYKMETKDNETIIQLPTRWLADYDVQILDSPALHLSGSRTREMLFDADIIIFVTDTVRRLTGTREMELLEDVRSLGLAKNLIVVVNQADRLTNPEERNQAIRQVSNRLRKVLSVHGILDEYDAGDVPVFLTSAPLAIEAPITLRSQVKQGIPVQAQTFQQRLQASGLDKVRQYVLGNYLQVDQRPYSEAQSKVATANAVLSEIEKNVNSTRQILADVDGKVEKVVAEYENALNHINYDLSRNEGVQIEQLLDKARDEVSTVLHSLPVRKLWSWNKESVEEDVLEPIFGLGSVQRLGVSRLISLKYAHAIGRLNGTLHFLGDRLKTTLQDVIKSGTLKRVPETMEMEKDLERIASYAEHEFPQVGLEAEVCQGPIAKFDYNVRQAARSLDKTGDASVVVFTVWEMVSLAGIPLAIHFGLPILMSTAGGLGSAMVGWIWLRAQWGAAKALYKARVEGSATQLKEELDKVYFEKVEDGYVRPFTRLTNIYHESLTKTRRMLTDRDVAVKKNQAALNSVAKEMKI